MNDESLHPMEFYTEFADLYKYNFASYQMFLVNLFKPDAQYEDKAEGTNTIAKTANSYRLRIYFTYISVLKKYLETFDIFGNFFKFPRFLEKYTRILGLIAYLYDTLFITYQGQLNLAITDTPHTRFHGYSVYVNIARYKIITWDPKGYLLFDTLYHDGKPTKANDINYVIGNIPHYNVTLNYPFDPIYSQIDNKFATYIPETDKFDLSQNNQEPSQSQPTKKIRIYIPPLENSVVPVYDIIFYIQMDNGNNKFNQYSGFIVSAAITSNDHDDRYVGISGYLYPGIIDYYIGEKEKLICVYVSDSSSDPKILDIIVVDDTPMQINDTLLYDNLDNETYLKLHYRDIKPIFIKQNDNSGVFLNKPFFETGSAYAYNKISYTTRDWVHAMTSTYSEPDIYGFSKEFSLLGEIHSYIEETKTRLDQLNESNHIYQLAHLDLLTTNIYTPTINSDACTYFPHFLFECTIGQLNATKCNQLYEEYRTNGFIYINGNFCKSYKYHPLNTPYTELDIYIDATSKEIEKESISNKIAYAIEQTSKPMDPTLENFKSNREYLQGIIFHL